jgi:DNA-directed RNA polymerase specialized sigma24 family protein
MPVPSKTQDELATLPQEEVIAYILKVRRARQKADETLAQQVLLFRMQREIRRKVANRMDDFPDHFIDELAGRAFVQAVKSAAQAPWATGEELKSFKAWRNRIVSNVIADSWKRGEAQRVRDTSYLGSGRQDDEGNEWGVEPVTDGGFDARMDLEAVRAHLAAYQDQDRADVLLGVFLVGWSSDEAAWRYEERTGTTIKPNTVDQWKRRLRNELEMEA